MPGSRKCHTVVDRERAIVWYLGSSQSPASAGVLPPSGQTLLYWSLPAHLPSPGFDGSAGDTQRTEEVT